MIALKQIVATVAFLSVNIMFCVPAFSQNVDSLAKQFEDFTVQHLQEKIFVHTDKSFYLVGEIIWFKIYVTDAVFNKPLDLSKIAYVEIINSESKAVLQAKIELNAATGNGSFMLPAFLATGKYTIRAYTNWMKNSAPEYFFQKTISVVNTLKNAGRACEDSTIYTVALFPEGGQMVEGLPATVAFHFRDKYGAGVYGNGFLLNNRNDTIAKFSPHHSGIGKFTFTPQKREQYHAVVTFDNGKVNSQPLATIYPQGYVLHLSESDTANISVIASTNDPLAKSTYLFIHTRNRFKAMVQQPIINGRAEFTINKKTLDDGITHFTLFNGNRQPLCERLYFKRPTNKLDIEIDVSHSPMQQRSRVHVDLFTHQQQSIVPNADLSVSTFLLDSLQQINEPRILTYLLLTADLAGAIQSPDWYIENISNESNVAIDNLMLTHGWRRFKWEDILQNKKPYFNYLPELEGTIVTGKVYHNTSGLPATNVTAYLGVPGSDFRFAVAKNSPNHELLFSVKNFYGNRELIVQTSGLANSKPYQLSITRPFWDKAINYIISPLKLQTFWKDQLQNRSIYTQAENIYHRQAKQQFNLEQATDIFPFYGKPDKTYYLDDYTRFTTMEEVMREFVTEVRVRKTAADYNLKVKQPGTAPFFDSEPLVLLDGVPVFNPNKIMELDPLKIKKLEIINRKVYTGAYITEGIVSYTSYDGDLGNTQLDPSALIVEYEGLQRQRAFYSPTYNTAEIRDSRIPDFRNVLYWSPSVVTNAAGRQTLSFYTSDVPGKYALLVQGITADGLAGSKLVTFITK